MNAYQVDIWSSAQKATDDAAISVLVGGEHRYASKPQASRHEKSENRIEDGVISTTDRIASQVCIDQNS